MFDILKYTFFQNAMMAIGLIAVCAAIIGCYIVVRRLVFIAGGITHASFGGLGLGYYLGIPPTLTAIAFAISCGLGVEWLSKRQAVREDSAIAVLWSLGMALGILFIFLTPGYTPGLNSFLFGNLLTISLTEILFFALYTFVLVAFFLCLKNKIQWIAFDRSFAKTKGIPVQLIEYCLTILISIGIVLMIRLIGIMLLISVLTIPPITAELRSGNFLKMTGISIFITLSCSLVGLFISTWINAPTSACIVCCLVINYLIGKIFEKFIRVKHNKASCIPL